MDNISLILSAVTVGAMVIFVAPSIFALNRGHILRNLALWLAIFCALGLIYKNFGPGSEHQLFSTPASRAGQPLPVPDLPATGNSEVPQTATEKTGDEGFTPPSE